VRPPPAFQQRGAAARPNWVAFGSGDFSGDGKSDILWPSGGQAAGRLMNGTTPTSERAVGCAQPRPALARSVRQLRAPAGGAGASWKAVDAGRQIAAWCAHIHQLGDGPVRLSDLPAAQAKRLAELECPDFKTRPWVEGSPLSQRRVAVVSSAGLVVRGEKPFRGRDPDFRAIPGGTRSDQLLMSHISINYDRTGFQEDWNVVFPLDRLNELAAEGTIGSVAATHYSFMGATDPVQMEGYAREIAGHLKQDKVDAVILSPV
jgi:D-proline reductase (dithiol) PrdB